MEEKKENPQQKEEAPQKDKTPTSSEEKLKTEVADLTDTLKRVQADFINYKTRSEKEMMLCRSYAEEAVIKDMLPILDSFELALKVKDKKEDFIKGMELIFAQLTSMLQARGLTGIKAVGQKFDPYRHEVMMKERSEKESETILEEFQKGYMYKDHVLRHSKVKIAEESQDDNKEDSSE